MKNITGILIIGLAVVWLAACTLESGSRSEPKAQNTAEMPIAEPVVPAPNAQPAHPAVQLAENVEVDGPWMFAMETTPELLELTLHGTSQQRLAGRLADQEGRREIVYYGKNRRAPQVLFPKDWLLPAVGAVNRGGEMLVCVNRLVGAPSALTKGNVPDPSNGIDLACRWFSSRGWSREYLVPREGAALWLTDVVAQKDGSFRIVYAEDNSGLLVDDAAQDEGVYRLSFHRGRLGEPEMASRFPQPTKEGK